MKSFWWFTEDAVAGMARPGFNRSRWFDLPYDEAILLGWLGRHASGATSLQALRRHVDGYCAKIRVFYSSDEQAVRQAVRAFDDPETIRAVAGRLHRRTGILEGFEVDATTVRFAFCRRRLDLEIAFLKDRDIKRLCSLTERHHDADVLGRAFDLHHFAIADLDPPRLDQVRSVAALIRMSRDRNERMAVHCLAGIGRTSTMLMAAHVLLGESLDALTARIAKQNPSFQLKGAQADFLHALARGKRASRPPSVHRHTPR